MWKFKKMLLIKETKLMEVSKEEFGMTAKEIDKKSRLNECELERFKKYKL